MLSLKRHQVSNNICTAFSGDFSSKGKCCFIVNRLIRLCTQDGFMFRLYVLEPWWWCKPFSFQTLWKKMCLEIKYSTRQVYAHPLSCNSVMRPTQTETHFSVLDSQWNTGLVYITCDIKTKLSKETMFTRTCITITEKITE